MRKRSKRYNEVIKKAELNKEYSISDAIKSIKSFSNVKFDETLDLAVNLGVDPKKADQMLRGTVSLPHGIGKTVKVLVLCKPIKEQEAKDAGADHVGLEDYIKKIQEGWSDIDTVIATPDVMSEVGKLGKILGTKGLMPNPKSGTVTQDVGKAVKEIKAGRIEFRVEKAGIVHAGVGKIGFDEIKLVDNVNAFLSNILKIKPSTVKGQYVQSITLSSTMGPGFMVNKSELQALAGK
jgi:large subunit ribosomal protein L1